MADQTNTLYVVIDPTGAQSGAAKVDNAINGINASVNNLNIRINQMNRNTGEMATHINNQFASIKSTLQGLAGIAGTVISVRLFESFVGEIQRVDRIYNGFLAMMNVTTGDIRKSADEYKYVTETARAYGVNLESLTKTYAKLRAATSTMMSENQTKKLFESFTAVSTVLHAESFTVERMFNAVIQIASKGQVHMEELKQQLGEHLPGALAIAATAMDMKMGEMIKKMSEGQISAKQLLIPLPDELMKRFGKAAEVASNSLHAAMNRLKTSWFNAFKDMSTSGISLGLSAIIIELDKHIQSNSETFKAFGEVAGDGFSKIALFIRSLDAEDIREFGSDVVELTKTFIDFAQFVGESTIWLGQHKEELILAAVVYGTYKVAAVTAAGATALFSASTTTAVSSVTLLHKAIGALAAFVIGWKIGEYLREEFVEVEQAGIMLAARFTKLPVEISGAFEVMKLELPLFFHEAFENILNEIFEFVAKVQNLGPSISKMFGFDGEFVKPMKFDFTSNLEDEISRVKSNTKAKIASINSIYREMYVEADAKRNTDNKPKSPLDVLGLSQKELDESKSLIARYNSLKTEAENLLGDDPIGKDGKGSKAAAKAAKEAARDFEEMNRLAIDTARNGVQELQGEYELFEEQLKSAQDGQLITTQQYLNEQLIALQIFTERSKALLRDSIDFNSDPRAREKVNGEIMDLERKFQLESAKILRDKANDRARFASEIERIEIESGTRRLSEQEKFVIAWRDREGRLMQEAQMNGDQESVDRLLENFNVRFAETGNFWAQWLKQAEDNLSQFDQLAGEVINNSTKKFGNMFEQVIFDSENAREAVANFAEGMSRSIVNAIGQMLAQWLAYKAIQAMGIGTQASASATSQSMFASAKVAEAGLNAFASTAAIPIVGPALAPAAATAAMGFAAPLAATVTSLATSAAGASFAGAFDEGGHIPAGKWGIVGEYGPELIDGPANVTGRKDTADLLKSKPADSIVINQEFNVTVQGGGANGNEQGSMIAKQLRQEMKSAVMEVLLNEKRPGGVLA